MKRIKYIFPVLLAGFATLMFSSCKKSDADIAPGNSNYMVNILAGQFDPASVTMLPAAKVTWTNRDTEIHSVVSDDATSFNSGNIAIGGTFSFTPPVTGTYTYYCAQHPGVRGTLNVVTR